jgi:hypothetical protein
MFLKCSKNWFKFKVEIKQNVDFCLCLTFSSFLLSVHRILEHQIHFRKRNEVLFHPVIMLACLLVYFNST